MKNLVIEELQLEAEIPLGTPGSEGLSFGEDRSIVIDFEVPTKYEICDRCSGDGRHCNPSIGAISGEEWERDWDEDSREGYFSGRYDVSCEAGCDEGKARVPDLARLPEFLRSAVETHYENEASYASERAHEREMGY